MILHLETSTQNCSVALSSKGKLLAFEESDSDGYIHGEQLTLFIEKVLRTGNVTLKQLEGISVSIGPGSYTGLRIGVSTAKGLALGLNLPIFGISSLESMVEIGQQKYGDKTFVAALEARKSEVFLRIESDKKVVFHDNVVDLATFQWELSGALVLLGNAHLKLQDFLGNHQYVVSEIRSPSALGQVNLAWKRTMQGLPDDVNTLIPNYAKPCFINVVKS